MISNQLLQRTIERIKSISGADLAILELSGEVAVKTYDEADIDPSAAAEFAASGSDGEIKGRHKFFKIKDDSGRDEYVLAVRESGLDTALIGEMARFQIETLIVSRRERLDKDNFFKSLLLDNMLMIDIFDRARKLHVSTSSFRSVMIVDLGEQRRKEIIESVRQVIGLNADDFVTAVDKNNLIIVKSVASGDDYPQLESTSESICDAVLSDTNEKVRVSFGSIVPDLKDISKSYKEARMAMDVSEVFFEGRRVNPYNRLGIGRLVYQLPIPLCKRFIRETFGELKLKELDEEIVATINKFFENSLNVSETSRQLYIHRNTLVYRLDKIQKMTGLDLRVFEDAITFKIALMVSDYMESVESKDK